MMQYKVYGVRLPMDASAQIEATAERTGIQKSVLLRSIVMEWIRKEQKIMPAQGVELGRDAPQAGSQHTQQEVAVHG